ncbi:MAG: putative rane protein [Paenibacillus sp.]|jgi:hypothetical protein|nr:putative rane protein [Paenibacillus sp.]
MLFNAVRSKISALLVFALLLSTIMPVTAFGAGTQFKDTADSYAQQEIQTLVEAGVISGYEDNTFQPKKAMTRAELAKIIVLSLGLKENEGKAASFKDVDANSWYRGFVGALVESGITQGTSPTTFAPDSKVTREELVVFFIRAFALEDAAKKLPVDVNLSDLSDVSEWARAHVALSFKMGFVNGVEGADGMLKFNPKDHAERQALARLAYEFKVNKSKYVDKAKELAAAADKSTMPAETPATTPEITPGTTDGGSTNAPSRRRDRDNTPPPTDGEGPIGENPGNGGNPNTPGILQAFVNGQSTDSIFAGDTTEVTFRLLLNSSDAANVKLNKVDDNNNVISELTDLYDDGNGVHGDSILSDGVYSGKVTLTENTEGYIRLQALFGDSSSNVLKLSVVGHLTDQQFSEAESMTNAAQTMLDQLIDQKGNTQAVKEEAVAWLQTQPGVNEAGISGSAGSIWYVLDSGILGGISAAPENSKGLSTTAQAATSADIQNSVASTVQSTEQTSTSVGSKRVAVISPFAGSSTTVYDDVYTIFQQSEYPFAAERIKNSAATVDFFKSLKNYGIVVIDTHGDTFYDEKVLQKLHTKYGIDFQYAGPQAVFLTGEKATNQNKQQHELDLKKGRLAIISGYYAITPSFITRYDDSMPDTIVFNGSCRSLFNNSMADAFINNGARTYYGYTDYVTFNYDQAVVQTVFNSLIKDNKTTEEAFNAAVAAHGANDSMSSFAMKGSSIGVKPAGVLNGTFETGTWNGWNGNGDVRVILQLSSLKPTEGSYMAMISTGLGYENNNVQGKIGAKAYDYNSDSYIEQNFIIPEGVNTLSFDYNFITEEATEYVNSIFDDTFNVTVTSDVYVTPAAVKTSTVASSVYGTSSVTSNVYGEGTIQIIKESVNYSQAHWIPESKVAIDFYGGDSTTYMTDWKNVEFDVSQFAGSQKPIVLRFHVWDQGDSIYDTAVLIDNIQLK